MRYRTAAILGLLLVLGLVFGIGPAWAVDEPTEDVPEQTAAIEGSTTVPNETASVDSYTQQQNQYDTQAESSGTIKYAGCRESWANYNTTNTSVDFKRCVQYSTVTKLKRLKIRVTCRNIVTGALTTCHHWWSQDPKGHLPTYRMLYLNGSSWFIYAYSNTRAPALNVTSSVAYSQWGRDFTTNVSIRGQLRNLGITLHGGVYVYPFTQYTNTVTDGGTI